MRLRIRELMKEYNVSENDIVNGTNISKYLLRRYIDNNFININSSHIDLLCKYFNCNIETIIEIDSNVKLITSSKSTIRIDNMNNFSTSIDIFPSNEICLYKQLLQIVGNYKNLICRKYSINVQCKITRDIIKSIDSRDYSNLAILSDVVKLEETVTSAQFNNNLLKELYKIYKVELISYIKFNSKEICKSEYIAYRYLQGLYIPIDLDNIDKKVQHIINNIRSELK